MLNRRDLNLQPVVGSLGFLLCRAVSISEVTEMIYLPVFYGRSYSCFLWTAILGTLEVLNSIWPTRAGLSWLLIRTFEVNDSQKGERIAMVDKTCFQDDEGKSPLGKKERRDELRSQHYAGITPKTCAVLHLGNICAMRVLDGRWA